jgi:hypothetical protein
MSYLLQQRYGHKLSLIKEENNYRQRKCERTYVFSIIYRFGNAQ